ncbi:hypothetical protein [Nocardioides sp. BYT-33-1]|uniref:hypothetical protein n=1 Tax=Nocardioides sp. BYT-33-1 TaxID=3416952 RepID=UPI003F5321C2
MKIDYTREDLIAICERAVVPHDRWGDRDTPGAQEGVGKAWAFLKAGCTFRVSTEGKYCVTDDRTIWIEIDHDDFGTRDWGGPGETETFYLPTPARLDATAGRDWY